MQISPDIKPLCFGAVGGAIALAVVGFSYAGWVTGGTADQMAQQRADAAVVAALAPICADRFRQQADLPARLAALKAVNTWQQGAAIEKGGWATMPGNATPNAAVARACADMLGV
jgi:alpha/beta superfamily hydrolase